MSSDAHVQNEINIIQAQHFMNLYAIKYLVITRGALGSTLLTADQSYQGKRVIKEDGGDAVGAGDACAASILYGLLTGAPLQQVVDHANRVGAYVASQKGATPILPTEYLQQS